jgi:3-phytase
VQTGAARRNATGSTRLDSAAMRSLLPSRAVRFVRTIFSISLLSCGSDRAATDADGAATVRPRVSTETLHQYDEAPRTPDADDPAVWTRDGRLLVIAALKDAGLVVYDGAGKRVQAIAPGHRAALASDDPPTIGAPDGTSACPESESGESYGRFNNVDVLYDVALRSPSGESLRADIAVVSDRGCDRLRIYRIALEAEDGPLVDITADDAPRVFPERWITPWQLASDEDEQSEDNPVDDQSTAYGLTLFRRDEQARAFVSQRSRSVVAEIEFVATADGKLTYRRLHELRFSSRFELGDGETKVAWTPCRESKDEDPQFEGLVVDEEGGYLYAAQEVVGIWRIPLDAVQGEVLDVPLSMLVERTNTFGRAYWATLEEEEYACELEEPKDADGETLAQQGSDEHAGAHLTPDVEGLAIYEGDQRYLIASSQGDNSFHLYKPNDALEHTGVFRVRGAGETDGHDVAAGRASPDFQNGVFVLQNGTAKEPDNTDDIGEYAYDGSTQFLLLGWEEIEEVLGG